MEDKEYYYGTSTKVMMGEWLLPSEKVRKLTVSALKKVPVTDNLERAIKYAIKATIRDNGSPVVYIVQPHSDIIRKNKTDYVTSKAKIISIKEIPEEDFNKAKEDLDNK